MTNLLVTGGAGFLGSHFVRSVLADRLPGLEGARVTVLDKLTYAGNFANLGAVAHEKRLDFVPGDVTDGPLVGNALRGVDAIVHFAAETGTARSVRDPGLFATSNVLGTQILLDAALRHGVARFLQISTDAVYGSLDDPAEPARESSPSAMATARSAAPSGASFAPVAGGGGEAGSPFRSAAGPGETAVSSVVGAGGAAISVGAGGAAISAGAGGAAISAGAGGAAISAAAELEQTPPEAAAWTESAALAPTSSYGATKAAADLLALAAHRTHGLEVSVVRVCSVYGPHQHPEKTIPRFVTSLLDGRPLRLDGEGAAVRDWLHVDDCGRAVARVLAGGRPGEVYHVGGSLELPERELARLVLADLHEPWDRVEPIPDAPARDHRRALDDSKIRRELGWHPRVEFTTGLAGTIHWYRANPGWWRPLLTF